MEESSPKSLRRWAAAALCRCAFRIQPDDKPIVIGNGIGAWPSALPTLDQQTFMDWLFSDAERAKREEELRVYQQSRANAAEPWGEPVNRRAEALETFA